MRVETFISLVDTEVKKCKMHKKCGLKNKLENIIFKNSPLDTIHEYYIFIVPDKLEFSLLVCWNNKTSYFFRDNIDVSSLRYYYMLTIENGTYEPWIDFDKTYKNENWFPRFMHDKVLISSEYEYVYCTHKNLIELVNRFNIFWD